MEYDVFSSSMSNHSIDYISLCVLLSCIVIVHNSSSSLCVLLSFMLIVHNSSSSSVVEILSFVSPSMLKFIL
jgi:hypothetical protein